MSRQREETDEREDSHRLLGRAPPLDEVRDQLAGDLGVAGKVRYHLMDVAQQGGHQLWIRDAFDQLHQLHQVRLDRNADFVPVLGRAREHHPLHGLFVDLQKALQERVGSL